MTAFGGKPVLLVRMVIPTFGVSARIVFLSFKECQLSADLIAPKPKPRPIEERAYSEGEAIELAGGFLAQLVST